MCVPNYTISSVLSKKRQMNGKGVHPLRRGTLCLVSRLRRFIRYLGTYFFITSYITLEPTFSLLHTLSWNLRFHYFIHYLGTYFFITSYITLEPTFSLLHTLPWNLLFHYFIHYLGTYFSKPWFAALICVILVKVFHIGTYETSTCFYLINCFRTMFRAVQNRNSIHYEIFVYV